jgi:hypothetical protein
LFVNSWHWDFDKKDHVGGTNRGAKDVGVDSYIYGSTTAVLYPGGGHSTVGTNCYDDRVGNDMLVGGRDARLHR